MTYYDHNEKRQINLLDSIIAKLEESESEIEVVIDQIDRAGAYTFTFIGGNKPLRMLLYIFDKEIVLKTLGKTHYFKEADSTNAIENCIALIETIVAKQLEGN